MHGGAGGRISGKRSSAEKLTFDEFESAVSPIKQTLEQRPRIQHLLACHFDQIQRELGNGFSHALDLVADHLTCAGSLDHELMHSQGSSRQPSAKPAELCQLPSILTVGKATSSSATEALVMEEVSAFAAWELENEPEIPGSTNSPAPPEELATVVPEPRDHSVALQVGGINDALNKDGCAVKTVQWDEATTTADESRRHSLPSMASLKGCFQILNVWKPKKHSNSIKSNKKPSSQRLSNTINSRGVGFMDAVKVAKANADQEQWTSLTVHPNSFKRVVHDAVSIFCISYDLIMVPLQLMGHAVDGVSLVGSWVTRVFWTCDLFFSFLLGYVKEDGSVEVHPAKTAYHYALGWFVFDLLLVCLDWIDVVTGGLRVTRIVRLLRLFRIREILVVIAERVRSERFILAADVAKITVALLAYAHVVACFWYTIGVREGQETTWVQSRGYDERRFVDRYLVSMHWALTQLAGGMDEVVPTNVGERIYAVFTFFIAFLLAAVFVSRLTSSMTKAHLLSNAHARQLVALRRYLSEHGISPNLTRRIQLSAQHSLKEQQRNTPEDRIDLLRAVSEPLLMDLHLEQFGPVLDVHPFLSQYLMECTHVMRRVCHIATCSLLICGGDILFNIGETPAQPKMYFVCKGFLSYRTTGNDMEIVKEGSWVSEAVLWTAWVHQGVLTAANHCRVCFLDAAKFQNICGLFDTDGFDPREYANHFVRCLNHAEGDVTDLFMPPAWEAGQGQSKWYSMRSRALSRALTTNKSQAFGRGFTNATF